MADNKRTQAERAASARGKSGKSKTSAKKGSTQKKTETHEEWQIPPRLISSVIFLALFVVLLVIFFGEDGALVTFVGDFIFGLIGQFAFTVSIPAVLYLFFIHAFSGKRPVKMRTICIGVFVLLCGCLFHLSASSDAAPTGFGLVGYLYEGGAAGTTGGVLCGLLAVLLEWLCGSIMSFIIFFVAAALTLLGGMQITIPSLVRAIRNRPRGDWDEEEKEEQDPASVVVNHIANKRIAYVENKRTKAAEMEAKRQEQQADKQSTKDMLEQIRGDVDDPVIASQRRPEASPSMEKKAQPAPEPEKIPAQMPPLDLEDVPVPQPAPAAAPVPAAPPAPAAKPEKVTAKDAEDSAAQVAKEIAMGEAAQPSAYCFPPIDLLKLPPRGAADGTVEMKENSRRLNETLASFKIEAHIINVTRGPSVTRYEVELEKGVRLSKLTTAADDIALSLGATGVRIAAIPGKISVVGIEVPNRAVTTVSLREVIGSPAFAQAKSLSSFAVGKDIGGNCIVGNIAKLPHMLIAGTTGSGKSVCMNSIIISLLYKASPEDVKLIMVDPKMVELGIYNGIPHLLIPVVTDPKKAAGSLQWAVTEMMRRYRAMSDAGVRDLESYNSLADGTDDGIKKLPQVVVIIDELADLMLVAAKEVEESICRIAQMGRAAGIHLIIATQRPSADVITGLMKANIPSRIAFAVASAMESRIILDTQGAEKLVGRGDMLYAPIGDGKPKRVQGCFVSDGEVEAVANYVKSNSVNEYDQQVMEEIDKKAAQTGKSGSQAPEPAAEEVEGDEMLPAAVDVILETGQASVSMLQRRLKLGYARAARIVDEMEERGIVGPFQGSKPRAILVNKEQWETMRLGSAPQMDFDDLTEASQNTEEVTDE